MFKERSLKKNAKFYTTVFLAGLAFLTTLTSVGFAALNQNLNIAGQLEYEKHEVWAENLSYDNTNTGVHCDTAQCMLDCLADDSLCPPLDFATASWTEIANASPAELQAVMEAGTTKNVDLGTLGVHPVRIANVSTPNECSTTGFSQTACGLVIEFADIIITHRMNPELISGTIGTGNKGGWPATEMRTYVNSDIYNSLPSSLRSVIIETTVVSGHSWVDTSNFTSKDNLYLLAFNEIYGNSNIINFSSSEYGSTRQLDFYASINNFSESLTYKNYNNSIYGWWLRSPYTNNSGSFYGVYNCGLVDDGNSFYDCGVSPAFRIGSR